MNRISKRIISALSRNLAVGGAAPVKNTPDVEPSNIDAFYQRMFDRDIYLHVSEISVVMVGVCLTGVSIINVDQDINSINTYVDDLLAIDSFIFLSAYLMSYWVVRVMTKSNRNVRRVGNLANIIFLIGMIFMVIISGLVVYQGGYSVSPS